MSKLDPTNPLKPRPERFAQLLAAGGAQRESYLNAGYPPGKSANQNASRLAKRVRPRVQFLLEQKVRPGSEPAKKAAAPAERDEAWLLAQHLEIYEREKADKPGVALRALGHYAKLIGMPVARDGRPNNVRERFRAMSPQERIEDAKAFFDGVRARLTELQRIEAEKAQHPCGVTDAEFKVLPPADKTENQKD